MDEPSSIIAIFCGLVMMAQVLRYREGEKERSGVCLRAVLPPHSGHLQLVQHLRGPLNKPQVVATDERLYTSPDVATAIVFAKLDDLVLPLRGV
jgi:hypothetical protein